MASLLPAEIQIAPLDFDTIRADIKRYLQNQTEFRDYNFEGSSLAVLIDVLAYDAYYHGWYTNFAVNETFLQTAQVRNSVVAAARQVGYVPRSASGALAVVDVVVGSVSTAEGSITVNKFTPFTSIMGGKTYTFYTVDDYVEYVNSPSTTVTFSGMEVVEGVRVTQTFNVNAVSNTGVVLTLLNQNVDSRSLHVSVKPNSISDTSFIYTKATSALAVNASSNVFFLFENAQGTYDLQFGDGRLGRSLSTGQQVIVNYVDTRGAEGNGANTFTYAGSALGYIVPTTNVSVTLNNVNVPAYGGAARESVESIKFSAPNIYKTQGRIVTTSDARAVILAEASGVDSVSVWGGEDNDPPTYGKIFIAMKPVNAEKFGPSQKQHILSTVLQPKTLPIVSYELVDPDYIYIDVDCQVRYHPGLTSLSSENVRRKVVSSVSNFASSVLGQFGSYFRYSQLSGVIDGSDTSIQSNLTIVTLEKRVSTNTATKSYTIDFSNPIYQPTSTNVVSVTSKTGVQLFKHPDVSGLLRRNCFIENDGASIHVYVMDADGIKTVVKSNVGTVDFETGRLSFTNFEPTSITTNQIGELRIRVIPRDSDVVPTRSQIILIPSDIIHVAVVEDLLNRTRTTFGRVTAGGLLGSGSYS